MKIPFDTSQLCCGVVHYVRISEEIRTAICFAPYMLGGGVTHSRARPLSMGSGRVYG